MDYDTFMKMEHLSMLPFNILVILSALLIFAVVFITLHFRKRWPKKYYRLFLGGCILVFLATGLMWKYIEPYREIYPCIYPGIRDRIAKSFDYEYFPKRVQLRAASYYLPERLEKNPLYEKEIIRYDVDYIGTKENGETVFESEDGRFFEYSFIHYTSVDRPALILHKYRLKDKEFIKGGFRETTRPFFMEIQVPEKEKKTIDSATESGDIMNRHFSEIIFP